VLTLEKFDAVRRKNPPRAKLGCSLVSILMGKIGSAARRSMMMKIGRVRAEVTKRPATSGCVRA
jgi:ribosomal protein S8E